MHAKTDKTLYDDAVSEVNELITYSESKIISIPNHKQENYQKQPISYDELNKGKCIRCSTGISWNIDRSLCYKCYKSLNQFADVQFIESHCDACGNQAKTSVLKPQCNSC